MAAAQTTTKKTTAKSSAAKTAAKKTTEAVKNDEKRRGDAVLSLLKNGEYNDKPLMPFIACGGALLMLITKISDKKGK